MQSATERYGDAVVFKLAGPLDHESGARVRDELLLLLQKVGDATVILDLSDVDYISSSGLKVLLAASRTAKAVGRPMLAAAPTPMVVTMFELSHVHLFLKVLPSLREATAMVSTQSAEAYEDAERPTGQ